MGQPILHAPDIPTTIPANKDGSVIKAELVVDGISWNVTCVSMGNPHCVTFGSKKCEVTFWGICHCLAELLHLVAWNCWTYAPLLR